MIRAELRTDAGGRILSCKVSGHSGYAESGHDIVCSAVSVLCTTCVNSLESVCGIQPTVRGGDDGYLEFALPSGLTESQRHDAQIILRALRQGLRDVAGEYPQYVQLAILNGGKQP